ncbi:MAG: sensor histidine kinase [Chloroflexota bacterium]
MIENKTNNKGEVWERWDWVWHVAGYTTLTIGVVIALRDTELADSLPLVLTLSALMALWYLPFVATSFLFWRNAPRRSLLYFIIGFVLLGGLVTLNVEFLMLAAMLSPIIFSRFTIRWAIGIVVFLTVALLLLYQFLYPSENWQIIVIVVLMLLFVAVLMGYFISAITEKSLERKQLLDELALTRASLLKAEREAGVLAERQRLARDIHDTLAQQFTSIIMHLSAARLGDASAIETHFQQVERAAREGLEESRRIIWDMRPQLLEEATLVETLEGLVARWSAENRIRVETAVTGTPRPLVEAFETALLRITQEALHNIKKHANAEDVNITLSYMPDLLVLDIADDGKGFIRSQSGRGFGLETMRERAEALGGTLTIESDLGRGTAVAVSLPLVEVEEEL